MGANETGLASDYTRQRSTRSCSCCSVCQVKRTAVVFLPSLVPCRTGTLLNPILTNEQPTRASVRSSSNRSQRAETEQITNWHCNPPRRRRRATAAGALTVGGPTSKPVSSVAMKGTATSPIISHRRMFGLKFHSPDAPCEFPSEVKANLGNWRLAHLCEVSGVVILKQTPAS